MARGDLTVFEEFAAQLGAENHVLNASDVFKLLIIDNTTPPTASDTTPTLSDYVANEVSTAGGYTANGETIANCTYSEAAGVGTFDGDNVVISQNGSGFTDAYWGIIYNDSNATDMAVAFVDLGGPVSEVAGDITVAWNASGIFTITVS